MALAAVHEVPAHRGARLRNGAGADRLKNLAMLLLERVEMRTAEDRRRLSPDHLTWNHKAAEIFEKALELRIGGCLGDRAMKCEILIDRRIAASDRLIDCIETGGDFPHVVRPRAIRRKARSFDLERG